MLLTTRRNSRLRINTLMHRPSAEDFRLQVSSGHQRGMLCFIFYNDDGALICVDARLGCVFGVRTHGLHTARTSCRSADSLYTL